MAEPPDLLVSDRDRVRVGEELRTHFESGRLTLDEFQERLDELHAARTEAQLGNVLRQLPTRRPSVSPRDTRWRSLALQYALVNVVAVLIWVFGGGNGDFWPKWVLVVTLVMFLRRTFGRPHRHRRSLPPPRPPGLP